ncbi:hypothetical protein [Streptomyces carpaticus]|uniref:DUF1918 domain-containing protein n=1 Tax=Streptomyces carpaticus TaxID=285558 RepID=A0ABV4ZSW5_9ACTN
MIVTCLIKAGDTIELESGPRTVTSVRSDQTVTGGPYVVIRFDAGPLRVPAGTQLRLQRATR